MAVSRRCVLAVQGIAVILLTVFVLVFILLVAVLRVSLGNCDDDCSAESSSNVAIVDIDDDDGCNGKEPCDSSKETAFYLCAVLLAVFGAAWLVALAGVAYSTCRHRAPSRRGSGRRLEGGHRSRLRRRSGDDTNQLGHNQAPQQARPSMRMGRHPKHPRPHSGAPGIESIVLEGSKETLSEANSPPGSLSRTQHIPVSPVSPTPSDGESPTPQPSPIVPVVTQ